MNNKKAIEVEKKFLLTPEQIERLVEGATLIKEGSHTDIYFDTPDFKLTRADKWLRNRSGKFEFKIPVKTDTKVSLTYHQELETDGEIRADLGLEEASSLEEDLRNNGYIPFATLITDRKSYEKDGFHLDIDSVDFGYSVVEIELMVDDEKLVAGASQKIMDYAQSLGLDTRKVRGKLIEYIYRFNPEHYKLLVASGTVKS